jgi:putative transcriptional regulator
VTQPREGGPFGVIINRPLGRRLTEILPEYESLKSRQDVVYHGGPVAPTGLVFLVHSATPVAGASRVLEDAWILSHPDAVEALLRRPDSIRRWRAYSGYAGWGTGQLQHELERGGWHVLPADAETVFEKDAAAIWPELSARAATRRTHAMR